MADRSYLDELSGAFQRWERSGFKDLKGWLTKDKKGNTVRSWNDVKSFGEKIEKPKLVRDILKNAKNPEDIQKAQSIIDDFYFPEPDTVSEFNKVKSKIKVKQQGDIPKIENKIKEATTEKELNEIKNEAQKVNDEKLLKEIDDKITEIRQIDKDSKEYKKKLKRISKLDTLKDIQAEAQKSKANQEVLKEIENKIKESRIKSGKLVTVYRDEIRNAQTRDQVEDILRDAFVELGEGKSFDDIKETSDFRIKRLGT